MMRPYLFFIYLVVAFFLQHNLVHAAEGGSGFYLLGTRHQMAGTSLPTGHYLKNDLYLYTGQSRDSATLPMAGSIYVGVDASAYVNLSTLIWVPNISLGSSQLTFMPHCLLATSKPGLLLSTSSYPVKLVTIYLL